MEVFFGAGCEECVLGVVEEGDGGARLEVLLDGEGR